MPTLEISIQVTQDGVPMPDLSVTRRLVVDNVVPFDIQFPFSGPTDVPGGLDPIQALVIRPLTQPVVVSLGGSLRVNAGGLFILFDGTSVTTAALTVVGAASTATQAQGLEAGSA